MPSDDPRSDAELVAAINDGDDAAFEALYRRYRDWVVRLAWRFAGNEADALDVLQETFAYLVRKVPGLRLTSSMTTFLYPAVKHLALAARRKRGRFASDADALAALAAAPTPATHAGTRDEIAAIVADLPEHHREVLLMRFADEMALHEIAAALQIPLGTVKSRLHNALQSLRADQRLRDLFSE